MKKILIPLFLFGTFLWSSLHASEAVTVDKVDFNSLRDDTIQVEIELTCHGKQEPGLSGREKRFVENIKVTLYMAFLKNEATREYDYYSSEVEIIIMEQGDDNNVYFYLPGLLVERHEYPDDPEFFYIEISVDGQQQKPQTRAMSRNIPNLEILNSFKSKVKSDGESNKHKLMPIYLISGIDQGNVNDLPIFLRRDVSE